MNHQPQLHLCERNICERSQEPPQPPWWEMKEVSSPGRLVLRLMLIYLKFHEFSWAWIIIACFFLKFHDISWAWIIIVFLLFFQNVVYVFLILHSLKLTVSPLKKWAISKGKDHLPITNSQVLHPGRSTWNLQITHLERNMIFQTSMIMFHVNLLRCELLVSRRVFVFQNHFPFISPLRREAVWRPTFQILWRLRGFAETSVGGLLLAHTVNPPKKLGKCHDFDMILDTKPYFYTYLGGGFKYLLFFISICGRLPFWLIFFDWVVQQLPSYDILLITDYIYIIYIYIYYSMIMSGFVFQQTKI